MKIFICKSNFCHLLLIAANESKCRRTMGKISMLSALLLFSFEFLNGFSCKGTQHQFSTDSCSFPEKMIPIFRAAPQYFFYFGHRLGAGVDQRVSQFRN